MTQAERIMRLIGYGYFDFFGLGTDRDAAADALAAAIAADSADCEGR